MSKNKFLSSPLERGIVESQSPYTMFVSDPGRIDFRYRFILDRNNPIGINIQPSFNDESNIIPIDAYIVAGDILQNAYADMAFKVNMIGDDEPLIGANANIKNQIYFVEIDKPARKWYGVGLAGYKSGLTMEPCYGPEWGLEYNSNNWPALIHRIIDANPTGSLTGVLNANFGLVVINRAFIRERFGSYDAFGFNRFVYLIVHEFGGHIMGIGHDDDPGVMQPGTDPGVITPHQFDDEDLAVIAECGYRVVCKHL